MGQKRNRRTAEEMLAHYEAQAERLRLKMAGEYVPSGEDALLKKLKRRLRKTNTELKSARFTIYGVAREDGKGWSRAPIADKIEGTKARLASQIETLERAQAFEASLPFDIERLEALIQAYEAGEDVDFPTDLTPLSDAQNRTDEEHETAMIASDEDSEDN